MTASAKRKPVRKGSPPRKAATRVAANGNGSVPRPAAPPQEFVYDPRPSAPGHQDPWRPPAPDEGEFVPTTQPEAPAPEPVNPPDTPEHPYGERKVYVFTPEPGSRAGDGPIVFPDITTVRPTYHFMWKIRKLDQVQQSFEWMDMAEVPDPIQERVTLLPDAEQARFFLGWFSAAVSPQTQVGPPGES